MTFDKKVEDSVITKFEINGEAVEIDPEATSWSYTSTTADAGWQVTAAKFSTISSYFTDTVTSYYDDLCENDLGLNQITYTNKYVEDSSNGAVAFAYSDLTAKKVSKVAIDALNSGLSTLEGMENKSVSERLAKAEELAADAIADIEEQYGELVVAAKEKATADFGTAVKTLSTNSTYKSYFESEDIESLIEDGEEAIEAATTLQGVFEAYESSQSGSIKDRKSNDVESKFYKLLATQTSIIGSIHSAASGTSVDTWLKSKTGTDLVAQQLLISELENYGVTVSSLPSEVAKEYVSEVLKARSFEVSSVDKTKTTLEVEAVEAIEEAGSGVTDALYKGIVAKYEAEIDALKSCSASVKTTLKATIENVASKWKAGKIEITTTTGLMDTSKTYNTDFSIVKGYLGLDEDLLKKGKIVYTYAEGSLLGELEAVLNNDTDSNAEIKAERVANVLAEYKTKWAAELAVVKANDSDYVDATSTAKIDGKWQAKVEKLGKTGAQLTENFALGDDKTGTDDDSKVVRKADTSGVYYSAQAQYEALVEGYTNAQSTTWAKGTATQYVDAPTSFKSVIDAKTWAASNDGTISKSYELFMAKLAEDLSGLVSKAYTDVASNSPKFITTKTITNAFAAKVYDEDYEEIVVKVSELEDLAVTGVANAKLLGNLEAGLTNFVGGKTEDGADISEMGDTTAKANYFDVTVSDVSFNEAYVKTGYGKFYEGALSAKNENSAFSKILAGNMTSDEVTAYVKNSSLKTLYKADVLDYTQQALSNFKSAVSSLAFDGKYTPNQLKALNDAAAVVESLFVNKSGCFNISGLVTAYDSYNNKVTSSSVTPSYYLVNSAYINFKDETNDKAVGLALTNLLTAMGYTVQTNTSDTRVVKITYSKGILQSDYTIKGANGFNEKALAYVKAVADCF